MTAYQTYLKLSWTSTSDRCEADCGTLMSEGRYVEGDLGHYCSEKCRDRSESGGDFDYRADERKQLGITS